MITLNTTIWDGDFDSVLDETSWFFCYQHPLVTEKMLTVNNIRPENKDRLLSKIKKIQEKHSVKIVWVDEKKEEAKKFFNIDINEKTLGYYYTIQYFVFILECKTPYIFNVSADCDVYFEDDFLKDSIEILEKDPYAITTTLPWSIDTSVGQHEENEMFRIIHKKMPLLEKFYYSIGFSDNTFIGNIEKLKKINYNLDHPLAQYFPLYGGNCFEKRVCSYFLHTESYRLIYKKYHYIHNTPTPPTLGQRIIRKIKKLFKA